MTGSTIARATTKGIAVASRAPHRRPIADQRGDRLSAAPSSTDGRTSIQRTMM